MRQARPAARSARAARAARAALAAAAVVVLSSGCAPAGLAGSPADHTATAATTGTAAPQRPAPSPEASPADGPGDRASTVPVAPATEQPAEQSVPPVRVAYPRLGADMEVVPTGVADDGQMQIPDDAATAAWYRFGKAPADAEGITVIAAHAGSESTPEGPLYALRDARDGDAVEVADADGTRHTYQVTAVEQVDKDGLDLTPYFERTGAPRLVLVTCGGQWLPERGSYADNVIVVAEPVG